METNKRMLALNSKVPGKNKTKQNCPSQIVSTLGPIRHGKSHTTNMPQGETGDSIGIQLTFSFSLSLLFPTHGHNTPLAIPFSGLPHDFLRMECPFSKIYLLEKEIRHRPQELDLGTGQNTCSDSQILN